MIPKSGDGVHGTGIKRPDKLSRPGCLGRVLCEPIEAGCSGIIASFHHLWVQQVLTKLLGGVSAFPGVV